MRHKGSYLGILWSIALPLLQMAIYTTVFGLIFNGRFNGIEDQTKTDYALGIFLSLTIYQLVAEVLNSSPAMIVGSSNLVKKVVFPLEVIPAAQVLTALINFGISMCLVMLGVFILGDGFSWNFLLLPVILFPLLLLTTGLAWALSALGVFLRDIGQIVQPLSLILLYASAVFYSAEMIPNSFWKFLMFNPLLHIIEQSRHLLLWNMPVNWGAIGLAYAFGLVLFFGGYKIFKISRPAFADVI